MRSRELLRGGGTRTRRDLAAEDDLRPTPRVAVGKLTPGQMAEHPAWAWERAVPGKLTLADVAGDTMSPGRALAYAERIIDRRADRDGEIAEGELASAFGFLQDATSGIPLPAELRRRLERELRADLGRVRVHTDARAADAARTLHARAFTIGEDIYFAEGAYDPHGVEGVELIAHEVAHVAQNQRGAAKGAARVSRPEDPHEREADDFARRFASSSPADLVREPLDRLASDLKEIAVTAIAVAQHAIDLKPGDGDAATRVKDFVKDILGRDDIQDFTSDKKRPDTRFGVLEAKGYPIRYLKTQRNPWTEAAYTGTKGNKASDLKEVLDDGGKIKGTQVRLHRVGTASSKKFVLSRPNPNADTYRAVVQPLEPEPKWKNAYLGDGKRGISAVPDAAKALRWGTVPFDAYDPAVTEDELKAYREGIEIALAEHFKTSPRDDTWLAFYEQVVLGGKNKKGDRKGIFPHPYKRIVGNVFEKLVAASTRGDEEYPISATQIAIHKKRKGGAAGALMSLADGQIKDVTIEAGKVLVETKAWTKGPGTEERAQAGRYRKILDNATSYCLKNGEDVEEIEFGHILYVFVDDKVAQKWKNMLDKAFGHKKSAGKDYTNDRYSVHPPYPGHEPENFKIHYNPPFTIPMEKGATRVRMATAPIRHAGLKVTNLDVHLEDGLVKSGSVTDQISMKDGALTTKPKRKDLVIKDGEATVPNEFPKVSGAFAKLFGERVKPVARVNDKGVEAGVEITPGKSGLAGFDLTGGKVTATYTNDGTFGVGGQVGLSRTINDGTITGELDVSYSGNDWTVHGTVAVSQGVIDGLEKFDAEFTYSGGEVTIAVPSAIYSKQLGGVKLTGRVRSLEYDSGSKDFGGEAEIEADLGPFGRASALAELKESKLERAVFSYDSPELKLPTDKPVFTGTLGGTIVYNRGKLSGRIRGDADMALPGLSMIAEGGAVGLSADARIDEHGRFSGSIESKRALKFGKYFRIPKLEAKLDEDGNPSARFALELSGIKQVKTARLAALIDKSGFDLEEAEVDLQFGNEQEDRVWGGIRASYLKAEGLMIVGKAKAKVGKDMVLDGTLRYSTKDHKASAELTTEKPIEILNAPDKKKTIFEYEKNIPLFGLPPIISLDLATSFSLDFIYGLHLGFTPKATLEELDLETLNFKSITAEMDVNANLHAGLVATPGIGIGFSVISGLLLSGSAGIKVPITALAELKSNLKVPVTYRPDGGLDAAASVGMSLDFGIDGAITPYAKLDVLDGLYSPNWQSDPLTQFTIMPKRQLFSFNLDFGGDMKKREPDIPDRPPPAAPVAATHKMPESQPAGATTEREGTTEKKSGKESGTGVDIGQLLSKFESWGPYASLKDMISEAVRLWKKFKGVINDIKGAAKWVGGKIVEVGGAIADGAEYVWDNTLGAIF